MLDESGFPQPWCFLGVSAHLGSEVSSVERQHEMGSTFREVVQVEGSGGFSPILRVMELLDGWGFLEG